MNKFDRMFKILKTDLKNYEKNPSKATEQPLDKDFALILPLENIIDSTGVDTIGEPFYGDLEATYANYQDSKQNINNPKEFKADIARAVDEAFTVAIDYD